ncbi:hypothetical protein A9Q74_14135 [Colwellia sp. 39_35_sub15_T18]|nr:hypothetical protein A9Q74_14135 [Colwellia sp. 39_35_sub15_T18]
MMIIYLIISTHIAYAASGSAVIPPNIVASGSQFDQDVQLFISNVSNTQSEIEITFFNQSGSVIHESTSSATTERLYSSSGYVVNTYTEPTTGPTVKFSVAPHATVHIVWSALHPSTSTEVGYGVIKWNKSQSNDTFSIIARGSNNTYNHGVISEASFQINSGKVF